MRFPLLALCLSWSALVLATGGCRSKDSPRLAPSATPAAEPAAEANGRRRFGAPIPAVDSVTLGAVLSKPDDFENRPVVVQSKVRRNCTRRGCWMELADDLGGDAPGCRVTFKDYGFFVPLDSSGSTARVQGTFEVRVVSAQEVAHLASEGAKFANQRADGSAREVRMVATGVELWRGPG
jgi:Domain of unknown function (DUF4920)